MTIPVKRPRYSDAVLKRFGKAVRGVRKSRNMSQEELAFASELDRTYISGVERGVRNPSVVSVARIAKALDVNPGALFVDF